MTKAWGGEGPWSLDREWSIAKTTKPSTTMCTITPGPPLRAQSDHQVPTSVWTGNTTIVRACMNGREVSTRPVVGLAG